MTKTESITNTFLQSNEWRILSLVYPALPLEGYPIFFKTNGTIEPTKHLGVSKWCIENNLLKLSDKVKNTILVFKYDKKRKSFIFYEKSNPDIYITQAGSVSKFWEDIEKRAP